MKDSSVICCTNWEMSLAQQLPSVLRLGDWLGEGGVATRASLLDKLLLCFCRKDTFLRILAPK